MSKVAFSNLPSFDQAERVFALSAEDLSTSQARRRPVIVKDNTPQTRPIDVKPIEPPPLPPPPLPPAEATVEVDGSDSAVAEAPDEADRLAALEDEVNTALDHALLIFESGIEDMQARINRQANAVALEALSALMPKLSDKFLADELADHLPDLLPSSVAGGSCALHWRSQV